MAKSENFTGEFQTDEFFFFSVKVCGLFFFCNLVTSASVIYCTFHRMWMAGMLLISIIYVSVKPTIICWPLGKQYGSYVPEIYPESQLSQRFILRSETNPHQMVNNTQLHLINVILCDIGHTIIRVIEFRPHPFFQSQQFKFL